MEIEKPSDLLRKTNAEVLDRLAHFPLSADLKPLIRSLDDVVASFDNPNSRRYLEGYLSLPDVRAEHVTFESPWVEAKGKVLLDSERQALHHSWQLLRPWRKGPFRFFGQDLDAEWRSDIKWNRLSHGVPSLHQKKVLDVGCNSGYYMFRMAAQSPQFCLGIDPMNLFYFQFQALQQYLQAPNTYFLPLSLEQTLPFNPWFDVVFCLGVLYHSRSPVEMLKQLKSLIKKGGTVLVETLIIEGEGEVALCPYPRYAKMPNVHFIPTLKTLKNWAHKAGFKQCDTLYVEATTGDEQRQTEWVDTQSLIDFLDPHQPTLTVEGYPAPLRACVLLAI